MRNALAAATRERGSFLCPCNLGSHVQHCSCATQATRNGDTMTALAIHYATGLGVALLVLLPVAAWTAVLTIATDRAAAAAKKGI